MYRNGYNPSLTMINFKTTPFWGLKKRNNKMKKVIFNIGEWFLLIMGGKSKFRQEAEEQGYCKYSK